MRAEVLRFVPRGEVSATGERLGHAKDAALARQALDEAALLRDGELRLRLAAAHLVRARRRHTDERA